MQRKKLDRKYDAFITLKFNKIFVKANIIGGIAEKNGNFLSFFRFNCLDLDLN